jgi:sugar O-acyltransferase (sialic acid O-acetyltransferase NeuD family)
MGWEARPGMRHPLQTEFTGERVVIVGTGEWGATAFEYFSYDSPHEIVAFSAEAAFIKSDTYCGLPVVPLEQLAKAYPPDQYSAFVAVSDIQLNRVRRRLFDTVKAAGFRCVSYVSSHTFMLRNVEIGENTFVQENAALEYMVRLGDNSVIEDDCYLGPHAAVSGNSRVGRGSFLGVNSCVADGVFVGEDCVIGAGAVVLKDTKPRQVYVGNPARPTGRDSFAAFGVTSDKSHQTVVKLSS